MELPISIRDQLVDGLEAYLQNFSDDPEPEAIAEYILEELETYADDEGIDDIIAQLEESGQLDASFQESLESEMSSNDEFEFTGEEIVSLLERLCGIDWLDDEDLDDLSEEPEEEEEAEREEDPE